MTTTTPCRAMRCGSALVSINQRSLSTFSSVSTGMGDDQQASKSFQYVTVTCRVGAAIAKTFLRTGLLEHVWPSSYHNDGRKTLDIAYIYKIIYTKQRYLPRRPFAFVSDQRRRDFCPVVCPFWLVAKVLDWRGGLTARMTSVYVTSTTCYVTRRRPSSSSD